MKTIGVFLLFTMLIYALDELTLPKCIKYESMQKVIENDWGHASKHIKKFMEHNSTKYVDTFMKLINKPLVLKTDEEYIQEHLETHKEYVHYKNSSSLVLLPIDNMVEYKKRITQEVKYKIYYFDRYNNDLGFSSYRMMYMYIRYLEDSHRYKEAFLIYDKIAKRFLNLYRVNDKTFINLILFNGAVEEYIKMLDISVKKYKYTKYQKKILYKVLSQCIVDKDLFAKMLFSEKNQSSKFLNMVYSDKNISVSNIITKEIFFKGLLKIADKENIEKHLFNEDTMHRFVEKYKLGIENIHTKILGFKSKKEYDIYDETMGEFQNTLGYVDMGRLAILYMLDKMDFSSLAQLFKYEFTSDEFVDKVGTFYIRYGKPWIWGKYKFEFEERLHKNKKFLDLLNQKHD